MDVVVNNYVEDGKTIQTGNQILMNQKTLAKLQRDIGEEMSIEVTVSPERRKSPYLPTDAGLATPSDLIMDKLTELMRSASTPWLTEDGPARWHSGGLVGKPKEDTESAAELEAREKRVIAEMEAQIKRLEAENRAFRGASVKSAIDFESFENAAAALTKTYGTAGHPGSAGTPGSPGEPWTPPEERYAGVKGFGEF